jgi:hypothetical protein
VCASADATSLPPRGAAAAARGRARAYHLGMMMPRVLPLPAPARSLARFAACCLAAASLLLVGCAPAADGTVTIRPVERDGVWVVSVAPTQVGRALQVRHSVLRSLTIPRGFVPPPGMCRVWRAGVAPGRQAPIGNCGMLERQAPAGTYLIYG